MLDSLFDNIYAGKKVLITGNTGFKGSWLTLWLLALQAKVYGFSIDIPTKPSLFKVLDLNSRIEHQFGDINDLAGIKLMINNIKPDFIFHLAAQPIVGTSYENPVNTFSTNIMGTVNLMEALRLSNHECTVIMVTSDKCYENQEWNWSYRENDHLGGKDPYSASKGACEVVIHSFYNSYFKNETSNIKIVSVRAGNVIGGGDWAEKRLIPDCLKAWSAGKIVEIRNPNAIRPWQHVLEPLSGYLLIGQMLYKDSTLNGEAFNFGPASDESNTVKEMIDILCEKWGHSNAKFLIIKSESFPEAGLLRLSCEKALAKLLWKPVLDFRLTLQLTVDWYKTYYEKKEDMYQYTFSQLLEYIDIASQKKLTWTIAKSA